MTIKNLKDMTRAEKITIYAALWNKLGREPKHAEIVAEVKRIISEAVSEKRMV